MEIAIKIIMAITLLIAEVIYAFNFQSTAKRTKCNDNAKTETQEGLAISPLWI
jgi:tetrahydromethanopterin S-methyltransferase subunit D